MLVAYDVVLGSETEIDALLMACKLSDLWNELHAANALSRRVTADQNHVVTHMFRPQTQSDKIAWIKFMQLAAKVSRQLDGCAT